MRADPLSAVTELDLAFNNHDIDTVLNYYHEEAIVVADPNTVIRGKDAIRELFLSAMALNGKATQESMHVIENGDIALFTSKWKFEWTDENGEQCIRDSIANTVFQKGSNGEWLIVIDNSIGPAILQR